MPECHRPLQRVVFDRYYYDNTWQIPEYFNIGTACTDMHRGTELEHRQAIGVIEESDEGLGINSLTYSEIAALSDRLSSYLREEGLGIKDRVLIKLPNCLEYSVSFFAVLKSGGIAVPASVMLSSDETVYLLNDSQAAFLITDRETYKTLASDLAEQARPLQKVLLIDDISTLKPELDHSFKMLSYQEAVKEDRVVRAPVMTRADDAAYLVYTSGTTGYPKGVLHAHRSLIGRLPASINWFADLENDVILHSGKYNWTYALGTALMDPLFTGRSALVYRGTADAPRWVDIIKKSECTTFIGVPTLYRQILEKTEASAGSFTALKHCMCAGEHLTDDVLSRWYERFRLQIYEALGMSECSYYLSHHRGMKVKPGSAGRIQKGHRVELLNAEEEPVEPGEEGMLCISEDDPGLFIEYWRLPEENTEVRYNGWFHTGDYACRDSDDYIWFMGRKDDIINSFGFRVSPHEVERVIKAHDTVNDCVVTGYQLTAEKTLITACIIPSGDYNENRLLDYCREHLAEYKLPKKIELFDEFPRTRNGKTLRSKILEEVKNR